MRAVLRFGVMVFVAGLMLGPVPALAQDAATQAPSDAPPTDSVGPRDLQNFTLNGTVTRSADPVVAPRPTARPPLQTSRQETVQATRPEASQTTSAPTARPSPLSPVQRTVERAPARTVDSQATIAIPTAGEAATLTPTQRPSSSVTTALPPIDDSPVSTSASATLPQPAEALGEERRLLLWPWLLAALALGAGGAFLFWRNHRGREAFAGGPQFEAFVAPEAAPTPRPAPAPAPPKVPPAIPVGIVSTRLRPWIELVFQPGRCIIENDRVTFEFELGLQNSGNAPARGVLVEASLLNAGPYQDQEVSAFYSAPVGEGERIAVIPPLKTIMVKTQVVAPRANVQLVEIAGRKVFVPLIAFNALYTWSAGEGQTSASYLLGRDSKGDKMGPFRLDLGPRVFRNVGARMLPLAVRK